MGERRRRARCHTPGKVPFRFEAEAKRAAGTATEALGSEMEHYLCKCGAWHLTRVKPPPRQVYGRT